MSESVITDDLYARNMAALFRTDGYLAQRIDEAIDDGSVIVEASRKGAPCVAVRVAGADRPVYLHSRVDPLDEAERFAASVELGDDFCFIVGGFGLGHHIKALFNRLKGESFLIVTEPNLVLLKAALGAVDLVDVLASGRCIILTSDDKAQMQTRLEPRNTLMMLGAKFVSHPASERVAGEFHATMRKRIADHMTYWRMTLVTLVANSRITCRNVANNLPRYLSTPPINILHDRFKGYPAIVVSAGPSLRRNIDQLAQLKGKAVIICVQTTFKTLLDRGITPDFVTSLDYHEMSRRFFENVKDFSGTHLVAEPKATWHVIDAYRGPVSLLSNDFARLLVGDELGARAGLKAGATVAHLAFYLALFMGCEPVVLVGQDLGYTDHVYYTPGTAMHEMWRPELNRFCTMEMKEWERIVRARKILMKVKDIHGRNIYTDEQLFTYLQQFEGDFAAVPGRVIDATEGGVRKSNTQVCTLAEVAQRYCREPIPHDRFAYRDELNWNDVSRLERGRDEVKKRVEDLERMTTTCRRLTELLKELTGLLDDPAKFNRRLKEVDRLRAEVRQQERTYQMISAVAQLAELQRYSADRRLELAGVEGKERARGQLQRDIRFVEAVIEGAEVLREILDECLGRFDMAMAATQSEK
ncbi:MAG TPA: DUF115 domain-containing protein [Phycisphaerae bacterium]|nr:DUF115 domain-containing protein [Phycisphaerae bacterium]HOB74910.1 DUF115 domain-containing protein [Phycisphaerae bacterium]HOJ53771.1 DUF115 domain-containing protein [Phycisphaerae bacterium]HOL27313.1 DUF115 domain-containing protein [Phycisphaerae bacterium]HPP21453.1 DUF115 domain-containing protein [Phycisphaerae bacterium]